MKPSKDTRTCNRPVELMEVSPADRGAGTPSAVRGPLGACMTTALVLSQREAACRRLRDGDAHAAAALVLRPGAALLPERVRVWVAAVQSSDEHAVNWPSVDP